MNNRYITYLLLSFIMMLAVVCARPVFAVASSVEFQSTPLFSEVNFLPDDSVTRWVRLTNSTTDAHRVIVKASNVVNLGGLGDVVRLSIRQGDTVLYDDTFSHFFDEAEVILPQVPAGGQATFDFVATFGPESGNEYQQSTMSFNLQIGFEDGDTVTDTTTAVGGSFGGGGGGNGMILGMEHLVISNEAADDTIPPQPIGVVVTWETSKPATSQVIYGPVSGGPYSINLTLPNFGYPSATTEDMTRVISHSVLLPGLVPGEYTYRVVSRASPPTVGYEHRFIVMTDGSVQDGGTSVQSQSGSPLSNGGANGTVNVSGTTTTGGGILFDADSGEGTTTTSGGEMASTSGNDDQTAAAFLASGWLSWKNGLYLLIFLFFIWLILLFITRKKEDDTT